MAGSAWQPTNDLEVALLAAKERDDWAGRLSLLGRAELLLPYPPELSPADQGCVVHEVSGVPCLLAFTSESAMLAVLRADLPYRRVRTLQLLRHWPDPNLRLACDPGLPVEVFVYPEALLELAEAAGRPANDLEVALRRATEAGDPEAYARLLLPRDVVVPVDPTGPATRDPTDPAFPWWRLDWEDRPVAVFSSVDRMLDQLDEQDYVELSFAELLGTWADPEGGPPGGPTEPFAGLAVDPGTTFDAFLAPPLVRALGEYVRTVARAVAVQVVVHRDSVDRYLAHGHDRVAGLIHRKPAGATPLGALYHHLDLLGDGSPFGAQDQVGYVVRWFEADPDAYREPRMDGIEVPDGATLWQIDQAGQERCLGSFTVDAVGERRWLRTEPR